MIKRETGFTPLERSSYHLNGIRKYIARMWLKSQPNFQTGFTLVELLIAMVMFVFVIAAASTVFTSLLTQFKQQSKIAETNIEGIIGLELLRQDIEHAGYGLPWNGLIAYLESSTNPFSLNDAPTGIPKAIISQNDVATYSAPNDIFNGSDYLVIKAVNVARSAASQKWTHISPNNIAKEWDPSGQRLEGNDRVIVLSLGTTRTLIVDGASFTTRYVDSTDPDSLFDANFAPVVPTETRVVYGVTPAEATPLRMPFNRADYFVRRFDSSGTNITPQRCAPNTGVFEKATVNHVGGGFTYLPLLDCVADMQVVYRLDTNNDGTIDYITGDISALTAGDIRDEVREVRGYILAHEGQRDPNFTFTNFTPGACATCIRVGETGIGGYNDFDLTAITDWEDYRWKLYILVVKPNNLG